MLPEFKPCLHGEDIRAVPLADLFLCVKCHCLVDKKNMTSSQLKAAALRYHLTRNEAFEENAEEANAFLKSAAPRRQVDRKSMACSAALLIDHMDTWIDEGIATVDDDGIEHCVSFRRTLHLAKEARRTLTKLILFYPLFFCPQKIRMSKKEESIQAFLQDGFHGGCYFIAEVKDAEALKFLGTDRLYVGRLLSNKAGFPPMDHLDGPIIWYRPLSRDDCCAVSA